MRSDHLACAHCGGIVSEGRCPACRATRQHLAEQRFSIPVAWILLIATLLSVLFAYGLREAF